MSGIKIKCAKCQRKEPVAGIEESDLPAGWEQNLDGDGRLICLCYSCLEGYPRMDTTDEKTKQPLADALSALEKLIAAELSVDSRQKYIHVEKLCKLAAQLKQMYSRRIADALANAEEGEGADGAFNIVGNIGYPGDDRNNLMRQGIAALEGMKKKDKELHPVVELTKLLDARKALQEKDMEVAGVDARIKEIQDSFVKPEQEKAA